jgi:hypothetical protein
MSFYQIGDREWWETESLSSLVEGWAKGCNRNMRVLRQWRGRFFLARIAHSSEVVNAKPLDIGEVEGNDGEDWAKSHPNLLVHQRPPEPDQREGKSLGLESATDHNRFPFSESREFTNCTDG